jgi:hypothetical protein
VAAALLISSRPFFLKWKEEASVARNMGFDTLREAPIGDVVRNDATISGRSEIVPWYRTLRHLIKRGLSGSCASASDYWCAED